MLKFVAGFATGIIVAALGLAVTVGITYGDEINSLTKTDDSTSDIADGEEQQEVYNTAEEVETVAESSVTSPAEDPEKSC